VFSNIVQNPPWAKAVASALLPLPFYFMELLVGFVQALVFILLTSVFTVLVCQHDEEEHRRRIEAFDNFSGLTVFNRGSRWTKKKAKETKVKLW